MIYNKMMESTVGRENAFSADNQQGRPKVHPWYICGFVEGEGSFHVALYKDPQMKFGVKIIPEFRLNQSKLRLEPLIAIQEYFGCGYIKQNHKQRKNDDTLVYMVCNRIDLLQIIIPFFQKHSLLSNKQKSFEHFQRIVEMLERGEHSTKQGILEIIELAYQMNSKGKYRKIPRQVYLELLEPSETICQTPRKRMKI